MKRKRTIRVEVTEGMLKAIEALHRSGLYGLTKEETARRLLERSIIDLCRLWMPRED